MFSESPNILVQYFSVFICWEAGGAVDAGHLWIDCCDKEEWALTYAATEPAGFPAESRVSCASQKFRNPGVRPFAQFARPPVRIHYHAFKSRGQRDHEPATYRYSSSFLQARVGASGTWSSNVQLPLAPTLASRRFLCLPHTVCIATTFFW